MKKTVLIQLEQKELEAIIFKAVCQAIKLNHPLLSKSVEGLKESKKRSVKQNDKKEVKS